VSERAVAADSAAGQGRRRFPSRSARRVPRGTQGFEIITGHRRTGFGESKGGAGGDPQTLLTGGVTVARDEEKGCGVGRQWASKPRSSQKYLEGGAQCLVLVMEQAEIDGQSR